MRDGKKVSVAWTRTVEAGVVQDDFRDTLRGQARQVFVDIRIGGFISRATERV